MRKTNATSDSQPSWKEAVLTDVDPAGDTADLEAGAVRAELAAALSEDGTRLGDVYRMAQEGMSAAEMASRLEIPSVGFAYSYRQQLDAILDGKLPTSAHIAS